MLFAPNGKQGIRALNVDNVDKGFNSNNSIISIIEQLKKCFWKHCPLKTVASAL